MKQLGLSANERIKNKKDFELIYSGGSVVFSKKKLIKAVYISEKLESAPNVMVAAVAAKKQGNAVWRNRIKRLIKESYRLNKEILSETCKKKHILLKIIFSPFALNQNNNKTLSLGEIMPEIIEIMTTIRNRL